MIAASTPRRRWIAGAGAMAAVLALGGCISLFPKTKPAQLYRFGAGPAAAAPAANASAVTIRMSAIGFPVAASGDHMLTIDGERAAYVAGGRWVTSAASLFEAAVIQTFETTGGSARLLARGEIAPATLVLKLDVRRFEARYDQGAAAPPTVVVEVYAALDNPADPKRDRERVFIARAPASDNRIGPIAIAYDEAVRKTCSEMVGWVNSGG